MNQPDSHRILEDNSTDGSHDRQATVPESRDTTESGGQRPMTDPDLDAIQENISPTERQIVIDLTGGDTTNGDNVHEQTYPIVKEEPAQGHLQEKENLEKEEAPQLRPKRIKAPRQLFDPTVVGQYYNTGSEVFWDASATQEQIEAYEAVHGSPLDQEEEKANTGIQRDLQNLEFLESKTKTTDDKHCETQQVLPKHSNYLTPSSGTKQPKLKRRH